jgi:NADPH:quinone reductase-like Zn-dependent oxidoreductase
MDLAGNVEAVGSTVTRFQPGDEVFGWTDGGSYAEYACAPEDHFATKPSNLPVAQAAAVPFPGFAALQALRDVGQVQAGQEVLVIGAAGGVGSFAVQLAKAFGAQVTGVCAPSPRSSWSARSAPTAWSTTPAGMSPTGRATGI